MEKEIIQQNRVDMIKESFEVNDGVISKPQPTPEPVIYNQPRAFYEQQIINIQAQKDAYDTDRDLEIAECQAVLDTMDSNGITNEVKLDDSATSINNTEVLSE